MAKNITVFLAAAKVGYVVRVLPNAPTLAGNYASPVRCRSARDAARTVRQRLELVFATGDTVQFANILFTSIDEVVKAVEIALDLP